MKNFTNELFTSSRLKSFTWRLGSVMVVAGLGYISSSLGEFDLSPEAVVFLGLVLGEITKAINNATQR